MKRLMLALVVALAFTGAVSAKTFQVPDAKPELTVTVPDNWASNEIEFGFSAFSPGKDVFFSIEYANSGNVEAMMKTNDEWMKENSIKEVPPKKETGTINGVSVTHFEFDTTDANGKTIVDFFLMPAGDHVAMITLWGSVEERNKHEGDIMAIMNSIKAAH